MPGQSVVLSAQRQPFGLGLSTFVQYQLCCLHPGLRRPGGAGRRLDVLVRWEGAWRDSWRSVTDLTTDMRKRARVMEREAHRRGDKRVRERD